MNSNGTLTIRNLADLAGVSVRTLHYYDEIGLLKPQHIGENGYRFYGNDQLLLLQQVLFFRELEFSLNQIKDLLDQPNVDLLGLLETHKQTLTKRIHRLQELIKTVESTMESLKGGHYMNNNDYFKGFSEEKQAEYQKYAEEHWDRKLVVQSIRRWKQMTQSERDSLLADGERITLEIARTIPLGPASPETQSLVAQWYEYINRFYDCTLEIFLALGTQYAEHPEFAAFYRKIDPGMPEFLNEAIKNYCAHMGVQE